MRRPSRMGLAAAALVLAGAGLWQLQRPLAPFEMPSGDAPPQSASPRPLLDGATAWLNVSDPPTPEQLKGRVILVVFWAASNPSALRALPVVQQWADQYRDHGVEVIGVHTPEYPFEQALAVVQAAVAREGLSFPIAVDSDRQLWAAFRTHEWPAYYITDPSGALLGSQVGAGHEAEVERFLRQLLAAHRYSLPLAPVFTGQLEEGPVWRSPDLLFRAPLAERFSGPQPPVVGEPRDYGVPGDLGVHQAALEGVWQFDEDRVRLIGPSGRLVVRYRAPRCALVVDGPPGTRLEARLDGRPVPPAMAGPDLTRSGRATLLPLDGPRLYRVIEGPAEEQEHTLEVAGPRGMTVYGCTFR